MRLKERLRGIVAAVATAALALSVAPVTGLAAPAPLQQGTATVTGVGNATKVELYKVVSITNGSDNVLDSEVVDGYTFSIDDYRANNAVVANQIAQQAADKDATYTATVDNGMIVDGTATFTDIDAGLYLVKVSPEDASYIYQTVIMPVVPEADPETGTWLAPTGTCSPKVSDNHVESSLDKKVSADGKTWEEDDNVDTVSYNGTVYFQVSVELPKYNGLTKDSNVYFDLIDELPSSTELQYVSGSHSVQINGEDVSLHGGFSNTQEGTLRVRLNAEDLMGVNEGDVLTLTFQMKVASRKLTGTITNNAHAVWFEHATDTKPVETDDVSASVTLYGARINKVVGRYNEDTGKIEASSSDQPLSGAKFRLEKWNGEDWVLVMNVDADPSGTLSSLGAGQYRWIEIEAPAGYQLNETPLTFTIDAAHAGPDFIMDRYFGDLEDTTGAGTLPETGGPGTIALTVAGVGLIAGAAVWAVRSRKEN